jgi:tetratricopeptide (TPR) repeat protein
MKLLKPDDLLIRLTPVELERWSEGGMPDGSQPSRIRLERHQELEQAVRNNPVDSAPYVELARIHLHQSRWVEARRVLDRAAEQFPSDEAVLFLREEAQLARSLQLYNAAKLEYREEPTFLTEAAVDRCRTELCALREKVCRARLARHPEQLPLVLPLADALDGLDRTEEAVEELRRVVQVPELRAPAALKLGILLEKQQRVPEALSAYRRAALFRVPPPPESLRLEALTRAAELARRYEMFDSAARYVQMLRLVDPHNPRWQQFADELQQIANSEQRELGQASAASAAEEA